MHLDDDMPGHKVRRNKDGTVRHGWAARHDLVKAGYEPKWVRLHYDFDDAAERALAAAACRRLQAEMLAWAAGARSSERAFDGTMGALVRRYQHDPASQYQGVKWNTRRTYDQVLGVIEKAFGKRLLAGLHIADFRRWYEEAAKPKIAGGALRVRKAHGIISMCRRLFTYGINAEMPECARLATILGASRFKQPGRRRIKLELAHVKAFVAEALKRNRLSLGLGTVLQFETTLRQRDVIGEWEPIAPGSDCSGIVLRGRRWVHGLTWADISSEMTIVKETTKTGAVVAHDLKLCPIVYAVLSFVPLQKRVGPLIIDENVGGLTPRMPTRANGASSPARPACRITSGTWTRELAAYRKAMMPAPTSTCSDQPPVTHKLLPRPATCVGRLGSRARSPNYVRRTARQRGNMT
jgi:hypothetical protein